MCLEPISLQQTSQVQFRQNTARLCFKDKLIVCLAHKPRCAYCNVKILDQLLCLMFTLAFLSPQRLKHISSGKNISSRTVEVHQTVLYYSKFSLILDFQQEQETNLGQKDFLHKKRCFVLLTHNIFKAVTILPN